jgi:hypothetical protein
VVSLEWSVEIAHIGCDGRVETRKQDAILHYCYCLPSPPLSKIQPLHSLYRCLATCQPPARLAHARNIDYRNCHLGATLRLVGSLRFWDKSSSSLPIHPDLFNSAPRTPTPFQARIRHFFRFNTSHSDTLDAADLHTCRSTKRLLLNHQQGVLGYRPKSYSLLVYGD